MEWFDQLQREQLAGFDAQLPQRASWLRELDAIYLYGTLGGEAVLLRNGTVRVWIEDTGQADEEVAERDATPQERVSALVLGAERHPVLRQLLPTRPSEAHDCDRCGGSGRILQSVICPACDGLGWARRQPNDR